MVLRTFGWSFGVTAIGLLAALWYGGSQALLLAAVLAVLEVSLSFDNAVINSTVLERMSARWRQIFLTVGIAIAVFGMRLLFPLVIVGVTANLTPTAAISLALAKGDPDTPGSYGYLLHEAHPAIAAFGGVFLMMIFLGFVFEEREISWLTWLERPLARFGRLDQLATVTTLALLLAIAHFLAGDQQGTVLAAGVMGTLTYLMVRSLGDYFEAAGRQSTESAGGSRPPVVGRAAFFLFLYLELLDASFSFDGVIGAFAITSDPILIAIGLGIGAMYIRSLTLYLVRRGTLAEYVFLEHGAHWAIGALALILLLTIRFEISEVVTGLLGVGFIAAAFGSSLWRRRQETPETARDEVPELVA